MKRKFTTYPGQRVSAAREEIHSASNRTVSTWSKMKAKLKRDLDRYEDPLYEYTDAGSYLIGLCSEVEEERGLYVEPSVQAGSGGVWIYDQNNNMETVASDYDFYEFDEGIIDAALESRSEAQFKQKYSKFLDEIIAENRE